MNSYRPRPVTRDTRHNDPRREEHRATADQRCAPAIGPTPKHRRVMPEEHTSTPPADFLEGRGPLGDRRRVACFSPLADFHTSRG